MTHTFHAPLLLLALAACSDPSNPAPLVPNPPDPPAPTVQLGDPLPGLTEAELASFARGRELFNKRFKPSEGLGPLYNATSCSSCHSKPVAGGGSELYRNFYVAMFGTTTPVGGLPSPVIPAFGPSPFANPRFSLEAGRVAIPTISGYHVAQRNSIPIFGVGLFEFVTNQTILDLTDPDDLDGDGISGRANFDGAGLGRFGLKAQSNNIELFTRAPLMNQMGITTDPLRGSGGTVSLDHGLAVQASSNPNDRTLDNDGVPDPELSPTDLGDLIAFSRFLAPPQPRPFDAAATRGQQLFAQANCTGCHLPELPSSRGPIRAYTDLLIHDMGDALGNDLSFGRPQVTNSDPDDTTREFRTQPLWGVSLSGPFLHDGRANTLDEAIRMHAGEAQRSLDAFLAMTDAERADILAFLEHL